MRAGLHILVKHREIRHLNSVILNSVIAYSVMPGIVDMLRALLDAGKMSKIKTTMPLRTRFARNLRVCRVRQGISQEQLATLAGLSRTFVSDVERELRNCSIDNIERLASALQVDVSLLFTPVSQDELPPDCLPKGPRYARE
jgi:DNA-binding XRE family transcriptional regulator